MVFNASSTSTIWFWILKLNPTFLSFCWSKAPERKLNEAEVQSWIEIWKWKWNEWIIEFEFHIHFMTQGSSKSQVLSKF